MAAAARGEARIAVGPRSAVFAPVADLGLIVVDEEHDASFKHEGDPRYDARRVAAERARRGGRAAAGRGSATPRPETWHALPRLELPARVDGAPAAARARCSTCAGAAIRCTRETRRALASARKAIVLLNRRGWSNFLTCRSCGKVWECPHCDVALVLHRAEGAIACHHCGHRERVPERCDACGSLSVARHGAGTERLEAELREALDVPVFRLDADTAATKDAVPGCSRASGPRPPGCCSAPRWWPRATTSPTSRSASCSTPTRRCASPTSAPRSGRSR